MATSSSGEFEGIRGYRRILEELNTTTGIKASAVQSGQAIISFAGGVAHYFVVRPFEQSNLRTQSSIEKLDTSIVELQETLKSLNEKLNTETRKLDARLVKVEDSSKSAHHRIDGIERRVENLEHVV